MDRARPEGGDVGVNVFEWREERIRLGMAYKMPHYMLRAGDRFAAIVRPTAKSGLREYLIGTADMDGFGVSTNYGIRAGHEGADATDKQRAKNTRENLHDTYINVQWDGERYSRGPARPDGSKPAVTKHGGYIVNSTLYASRLVDSIVYVDNATHLRFLKDSLWQIGDPLPTEAPEATVTQHALADLKKGDRVRLTVVGTRTATSGVLELSIRNERGGHIGYVHLASNALDATDVTIEKVIPPLPTSTGTVLVSTETKDYAIVRLGKGVRAAWYEVGENRLIEPDVVAARYNAGELILGKLPA